MKICVATGTRAEYGLLKPLMSLIKKDSQFELQILVTGAHLSPEFGLTYSQIEEDGFQISQKVEMLLSSDSAQGVVKSMGVAMIGFADAFELLKPDLLIILGDRYEILSLASAALIYKIPIAHLHGGEITEGAYDDAIRHSITKMSQLHFASTEEYKKRIIQLGEQPTMVHNVGAIGIDNIIQLTLLDKVELERQLEVKFSTYNFLIAFHPETLEDFPVADQFQKLLDALHKEESSFFIFTYANADTNGRVINKMIGDYVSGNPNKSAVFSSLGSQKFLSLLKFCDAIIGNSSSGIIEAPSVHTATINIGDRQKGRTQAKSVINCSTDVKEISDAIFDVKSEEFRNKLTTIENPYGKGGTAKNIINVLKQLDTKSLRTKIFFNV